MFLLENDNIWKRECQCKKIPIGYILELPAYLFAVITW